MGKNFSATLLKWYGKNQRPLLWRQTSNPYHILVSEIMLQQTQVARVLEKFPLFLRQFPTLERLAHAPPAEVIKAWSGMGYNRRALLLQRFAQEVLEKHDGEIPRDPKVLYTLPGIGPYTAGALAAFAYNHPEPAIDVNVRRIFLRYFQGKDQGLPQGTKQEGKLYKLVKSSIPQGKSREFHNTLMDFGSLVCTRETPSCGKCLLQSSCRFYPLYRKRGEKALFHRPPRQEPGTYEKGKFVPNRIFRGRLVEWVRKNEDQEISVTTLGKVIKEDFTGKEKRWLISLCQGLQKEKLLFYTCNHQKICFRLSPSPAKSL
ncbi:MAG: A/G-specific adenine glycosylase [Nanoarchaeota archaeon]